MPHIQLARPKWSEDQIHRALERELRSGIKLKEAVEQRREIEAAHEAATYKQAKTLKSLGKHVAEIPQWEFHNLVKKYGYEEVHSRGFMRDFQKRFPHLSTARV